MRGFMVVLDDWDHAGGRRTPSVFRIRGAVAANFRLQLSGFGGAGSLLGRAGQAVFLDERPSGR